MARRLPKCTGQYPDNSELEAAWHAASEDMAKAAQAGPQPGAQDPFGGQGPFQGGQAGPQGADDQGVDEQ